MDKDIFNKEYATAALVEQTEIAEQNLRTLRELITKNDPHDHVGEISKLAEENNNIAFIICLLADRLTY